MSVNQRYGINPNKTEHLGKMFHTIDFECNENYAESEYLEKSKRAICGSFIIGNSEFKLTYSELKRVMETAENALETLKKKYKMGRLVSR